MLTTERKIEIATAVMNDRLLGEENTMFYDFAPYGICEILLDYAIGHEYFVVKRDLSVFANKINIPTPLGEYWFSLEEQIARTERIEFLQKYIDHLKTQL